MSISQLVNCRRTGTIICLVIIAGISALSFSRTVGVAAQSLSVWGSSTVQASGGDSRRIGAIIVWFMVDVVGISARRVIGFSFISQAYRHESNLDRRHTGTIIWLVDCRRISAISLSIVYGSAVPAQGRFRRQIGTESCLCPYIPTMVGWQGRRLRYKVG